MSNPTVKFMRETIYGWIGNLMRDLDAQGEPVSIEDVAEALDDVLQAIDTASIKADFDEFLRDLNDGRGHE